MRGLLVVVLVALLAAPGLAFGATAPAPTAPTHARQTMGDEEAPPSSARLQLEGSGVVRLEGKLVTYGLIPEGATLWVRDIAGDARFFLDGASRRLRMGAMVRIRDASGRIYLSGSRVVLQIRADDEDISLSTAGRGKASVSGDGAFSLNDERERFWPSRARSPLKFAIEPPEPPSDDETPAS